jgi:hypothetical protein
LSIDEGEIKLSSGIGIDEPGRKLTGCAGGYVFGFGKMSLSGRLAANRANH